MFPGAGINQNALLKILPKTTFVNSYIEMMRPYNGVLAILGIIIGALVAHVYSIYVIPAVIVAFLLNGAGNVINDYFDYKIDKINRPKRPIPSGRVTRKNVLNYFLLLTAIGLIISCFISPYFLGIAIINTIVAFAYSWKLKGTALIGNIAVSWLAASTFLAGALISYAFHSIPPGVVILSSIAFLGSLSREIVKDVEDVRGDKTARIRTLPIVAGERAAKILAAIILIAAILSLLLPAYLSLFSVFYYIGMIPAVLICLAAMAYMKNTHRSQKLIKTAMYFVFLGFLLGALIARF
jgi:geranylgeranylglycerol-phosphate geranylgeranyltransferase